MSIREYVKDHLGKYPSGVTESSLLQAPEQEDQLVFWSGHLTENTLIDLTVFRDGAVEVQRWPKWNGPFTGRPELIAQLAPVLQASLAGLAKQSIDAQLFSLRAWWRVLDAVELAAEQVGQQMERVEDVRQLTDLHRQWAVDRGMQRKAFSIFVRHANLTLEAMRAPQLHWMSPTSPQPRRHLPTEDQLKILRIALKQEWFKTHDRWVKADRLRSGEIGATTEEEVSLLKHYQYYQTMQQKTGKTLLTAEEIADGKATTSFTQQTGLSIRTMKEGLFPNRWDIDAAFCLCLALTGWNPSTLLGLDATTEFLRSHPKDPTRFMLTMREEGEGGSYELTGLKPRAAYGEQHVFGLWKTRFGVGYIIKTLLERTRPLRAQLQQQCSLAKSRYTQMQQAGASIDALNAQFKKIQRYEAGCRSVWLYQGSTIARLGTNLRGHLDDRGKQTHYLDVLVQRLNLTRADDDPIQALVPSDLRDAFALWVWRSTGGNILAVMKALQHRWIKSTVNYVDNNIINAECNAQYQNFNSQLFGELADGRLDITILTHLCRYGEPSEDMQARLDEYRGLMRSRYKVACKDPYHPPKYIAPGFVADDNRICPTQRCLLCKAHAVLLPESVDGIAMRAEELRTLEENLPMETWLISQYQTELDNALDALKLFPEEKVNERREYWAKAIISGKHRVPSLSIINTANE